MNALLRRQGDQINELVFGDTRLDLDSASLLCGEESVRLSSREFEVMRMLMTAGEKHVSKEALLTKVWGYDSNAVENHVEVYVGFLRKKLTSIGSEIRIVGEHHGRIWAQSENGSNTFCVSLERTEK